MSEMCAYSLLLITAIFIFDECFMLPSEVTRVLVYAAQASHELVPPEVNVKLVPPEVNVKLVPMEVNVKLVYIQHFVGVIVNAMERYLHYSSFKNILPCCVNCCIVSYYK